MATKSGRSTRTTTGTKMITEPDVFYSPPIQKVRIAFDGKRDGGVAMTLQEARTFRDNLTETIQTAEEAIEGGDD